PPGLSRSIAGRCCLQDARLLEKRNRCSRRLVANASDHPAFAPKKRPGSRLDWVLGCQINRSPTPILCSAFRFARRQCRLSVQVRHQKPIAISSFNENVEFRANDKDRANPLRTVTVYLDPFEK